MLVEVAVVDARHAGDAARARTAGVAMPVLIDRRIVIVYNNPDPEEEDNHETSPVQPGARRRRRRACRVSGIVRRQAQKLKVGVLLPRSGFQGFIGQSCQKGADLAPGVIKEMLGVDIELMNADTESNVDTARTRAERLIQEGAHVLVGAFDSGAHRGDRAGGRAARRAAHHQHRRRAADHRAGLQVRVPQLPDRARHRAQRPGADRRPVPGHQHRAAHRGVHARQRHLRPGDGQGHRRLPAAR